MKYLQQYLILACLALAVATHFAIKDKQSPPVSDGYAKYAYSISNWRVFGLPNTSTEKPEPGVGRAPLYPLFLAGMMSISPTYKELVRNQIDKEKNYSLDAGVVPYVQMAMMSIVGFVVFTLARLYGSHLFFAYLCATVVMFQLFGMTYQYRLSESLAFPLFALASYCIALWFRYKPKLVYLVLAAVLLGLLALTRIAHLYFVPFVLIALFLLPTIEGKKSFRQRTKGAVAFLLAFAFIVTPWMGRNLLLKGDSAIGDSGTHSVLALRIQYNSMSLGEAVAGSVYWLPDFGDKLAKEIFPKKYWGRFEFGNPDGFRNQRSHTVREIQARTKDPKNIKAELYKEVFRNPAGHVLAMIPLTVRGLRHVSIFLPFALLALWMIRRDRNFPIIMGASILTIATYIIHVGITHFRARYGYPMLVGIAPIAALGMTYLLTWSREKIRRRPLLK